MVTLSNLSTDSIVIIVVIIFVASLLIFFGVYYAFKTFSKKKNIQNSSNSVSTYFSTPGGERNPLLGASKGRSTTGMSSEEIHQQLLDVFQYGKVIQLHTAKGPKVVTMYLIGNELRWENIVLGGTKKYKLNLKEVLFVEIGKKTKNLIRCQADEKVCFSLISNIGTLDIEASSEIERNRLSMLFIDYVNALKRELV